MFFFFESWSKNNFTIGMMGIWDQKSFVTARALKMEILLIDTHQKVSTTLCIA